MEEFYPAADKKAIDFFYALFFLNKQYEYPGIFIFCCIFLELLTILLELVIQILIKDCGLLSHVFESPWHYLSVKLSFPTKINKILKV